jgi:hypothetical protein
MNVRSTGGLASSQTRPVAFRLTLTGGLALKYLVFKTTKARNAALFNTVFRAFRGLSHQVGKIPGVMFFHLPHTE